MSTDRRMDKQNMLNTCNGILFRFKKEGNSDTCYNMDKPAVLSEDIMLSEISQLQKDNNVNIFNNHLMVHLKMAKMVNFIFYHNKK